jgi:hypothetical protein
MNITAPAFPLWFGWVLIGVGAALFTYGILTERARLWFGYAIHSIWNKFNLANRNRERKAHEDFERSLDESMQFLFEKLGDTSALKERGCLTLGQCALLVPAIISFGKVGDFTQTGGHYLQLALLDVARGNLDPKHPESLLPYSQYLRMAEAGMFGPDAETMPIVNAGWLVPLDEAETWIQSTGGPRVRFDGLKAELAKLAALSEAQEPQESSELPRPIGPVAKPPNDSNR